MIGGFKCPVTGLDAFLSSFSTPRSFKVFLNCSPSSPCFADVELFAKSASYAVDDIGSGTG